MKNPMDDLNQLEEIARKGLENSNDKPIYSTKQYYSRILNVISSCKTIVTKGYRTLDFIQLDTVNNKEIPIRNLEGIDISLLDKIIIVRPVSEKYSKANVQDVIDELGNLCELADYTIIGLPYECNMCKLKLT